MRGIPGHEADTAPAAPPVPADTAETALPVAARRVERDAPHRRSGKGAFSGLAGARSFLPGTGKRLSLRKTACRHPGAGGGGFYSIWRRGN